MHKHRSVSCSVPQMQHYGVMISVKGFLSTETETQTIPSQLTVLYLLPSVSRGGRESGPGFTFLLLVTLLVPAEGLGISDVEHGLGQHVHLLQRHGRSARDGTERRESGAETEEKPLLLHRQPTPVPSPLSQQTASRYAQKCPDLVNELLAQARS